MQSIIQCKHAHDIAADFPPSCTSMKHISALSLSIDVYRKYGSGGSLTLSKEDVSDMVRVCTNMYM